MKLIQKSAYSGFIWSQSLQRVMVLMKMEHGGTLTSQQEWEPQTYLVRNGLTFWGSGNATVHVFSRSSSSHETGIPPPSLRCAWAYPRVIRQEHCFLPWMTAAVAAANSTELRDCVTLAP